MGDVVAVVTGRDDGERAPCAFVIGWCSEPTGLGRPSTGPSRSSCNALRGRRRTGPCLVILRTRTKEIAERSAIDGARGIDRAAGPAHPAQTP